MPLIQGLGVRLMGKILEAYQLTIGFRRHATSKTNKMANQSES